MKIFNYYLLVFLCGCILLNVTSCHISYPIFGKKMFPKQTDTIELQQRFSQIRSIPNSLFESGLFVGAQSDSIRYRFLKPSTNVVTTKRYPLILVLHGSGAIGTDNEKQLGVLAKLWSQNDQRAKYPAFVLSPQFPSRSSNYEMDDERNTLTSRPQACLQTALQLLDSIKQTNLIDTNRIYVIGFSMGASTAINALIARPHLFAAGISISGIPQLNGIDSLHQIPIWLIHGNADTENTIDSDHQFYQLLKKKHHIRYWIFDRTEHNNIMCVKLLGDEIPQWLFKQSKH